MGETLHDEALQVCRLVEKICATVGPGCPCSPQEASRGRLLEEALKPWVDEVVLEWFTCSPGAFLGWFKLAVILNGIALAFFWMSDKSSHGLPFAGIAFAFATLVLVLMVLEFVLYKEAVDGFFSRKESFNVVGKIRPNGCETPAHIVLFGGHHDSALQFTWLRYLKMGYYVAVGVLILSVVALFLGTGLQLALQTFGVETSKVGRLFLNVCLWVFPLAFVFGFFFTERGKNGGKVPGATDNLASSALTVSLARIIRSHPELLPPDTEVRFVSFGSEEAGVRGAKRYVEAHEQELKSKETLLVNFDTLVEPELTLFKSDCNGIVRNRQDALAEVSEAAQRAGVPFKMANFPFGGGGTDTIPFSEKGIKAVTFYSMKVPSQMVQFYHQEFDTPDKVNPEAFENALKVCVEILKHRKNT